MRKLLAFIPLLFILFSACSPYEAILKSKDINLKFAKANEYYEQKKWMKANQLYEGLIPSFRGTKNYEELYYRFCYTFYNMDDYLSASYQFKNFTEFFPKSTRADETEFMYALCLYKMSQKPSLDQTSTIKAMEVLQMYINLHPTSAKLTEANKYIDECRAKLEKKDADAAKLYYNISYYKAAVTAYKALIFAYPESDNGDFYQFMIAKAYFMYAKNSYPDKQEERYAETLNSVTELKQYYPNSSWLKEAESYSKSAQSNINKIRNEQPK